MKDTDNYRCAECGYIYYPSRGEPRRGIQPGTAYEDLPDDYSCAVCGVGAKTGRNAFLASHSGLYRCVPCGYIYDPFRGEPSHGIRPGTAFEDLPNDYTCPVCGAYAKVGKDAFVPTR